LFRPEPGLGIPVAHLPAEVDLELGRVEQGQGADPALARAEVIPVMIERVAEGGDDPHAGDHDAARHDFVRSSRYWMAWPTVWIFSASSSGMVMSNSSSNSITNSTVSSESRSSSMNEVSRVIWSLGTPPRSATRVRTRSRTAPLQGTIPPAASR